MSMAQLRGSELQKSLTRSGAHSELGFIVPMLVWILIVQLPQVLLTLIVKNLLSYFNRCYSFTYRSKTNPQKLHLTQMSLPYFD